MRCSEVILEKLFFALDAIRYILNYMRPEGL